MSNSNKNSNKNKPAAEVAAISAEADAQLDAELKELIGDATEVSAVAASGEEEIDLAAIDAEANAASAKTEAYAEQEGDPTPTASVTSITAGKKKAASTPRVSRAAGARASSVLVSKFEPDALLKAAMLVSGDVEDESLVEALKDDVDKLAKKVGDKAVNLIRFQGDSKKLQGYTRIGLSKLIEDGEASSKQLTDHFVSAGYTIGTARSQANQLMTLFPALKVAHKSGRNLLLNADSTIAASFKAATA